MAKNKHKIGAQARLEYLIEAGWDSHPMVKDSRAKRARNNKKPRGDNFRRR